MKNFIAVAKALSDTSRVRTLLALRKGELCVCRIIALLGLAPSTVSKHMSVLKQAGLVQSRKEERWMYYRLTTADEMDGINRKTLDWVFRSLAKDEGIVNDVARLARILRQSPETLCKKRHKK
jgi:DNA-binding transcriptional ArsR family regulator